MNKFYKENGYFLIRNFINVFEIRNEIYKVFENIIKIDDNNKDNALISLFAKDTDAFVGCANVCQSLLSITRVSVSLKMFQALNDLGIKNPIVNMRPCVSFSSKKTAKKEYYWKTPPHQDWPSTQGSLNGLTCWIPLVDVDSSLGSLEVSPKTHLLGPLSWDEKTPVLSSSNKKFEYESIPMKAGDALFFSNFLVHRSGTNITKDKIRISMHFRYDDSCEPVFIKRKYPKYKIETRGEGNTLENFPMNDFLRIFE